MTDDDERNASADETNEPWVTGAPGPVRRVPGIDETSETTYVEPQAGTQRRAILAGLAVGLTVTAIFAAIVLTGGSTGDAKHGAVRPNVVVTTPSKKLRNTTTTTWATATTTTTAAAAPTATTAAPLSTTATTAAPPPTPRATAFPAAPAYAPVPMPAGVSGALTACSWQPTNGGQYQAAGTLTNGPSTNHGWTITMHWLQNGRQLSQQSAVVDLGPSQSKPWSLALSAPNPPADPFSCALSAA